MNAQSILSAWGLPTDQKFGTIVADFPWQFKNRASRAAAEDHYATMDRWQVMSFPVPLLANPDACHLYLWTTDLHDGIAKEAMALWGFEYKMDFVWIKAEDAAEGLAKDLAAITGAQAGQVQPWLAAWLQTNGARLLWPQMGMGNYGRHGHEKVIFGTRGKGAAKAVQAHDALSWFVAPRREHSQKPEAFQDLVERLSPGPRLELFATRQRSGWTCWGPKSHRDTLPAPTEKQIVDLLNAGSGLKVHACEMDDVRVICPRCKVDMTDLSPEMNAGHLFGTCGLPCPVGTALAETDVQKTYSAPVFGRCIQGHPPAERCAACEGWTVVVPAGTPGAIDIRRPTKWGNPYRAAESDRFTAVHCFTRALLGEDRAAPRLSDLLAEARQSLRGKALGCCGNGALCHGQPLAMAADYGEQGVRQFLEALEKGLNMR